MIINKINTYTPTQTPCFTAADYHHVKASRIYKTLNINSITVPCDENIITNTLYGMMIRECGLHDVNPHPFILHIDYKFGDFFDTSVIDRFEWGIGWMWDDETNPRMAKISPYNLNQNILICWF